MVLDRIKYQLGYPEASRDMLRSKSVLTAVEQYSMGSERPLEEYLRIVGLNMTTKEVTYTGWCEEGRPPPGKAWPLLLSTTSEAKHYFLTSWSSLLISYQTKGFEQYNHLYPAAIAREIKIKRGKIKV